jgi:hypothetical protein
MEISRRAACGLGLAAAIAPAAFGKNRRNVARWGLGEWTFAGPQGGHPYVDTRFGATFDNGRDRLRVPGFYDGDGVYKIRFSPPQAGDWRYATFSNITALDGKTGIFKADPPRPGNHGLVRVAGRHRFAYDDGTPYMPFGTTSYAWIHQSEDLCRRTLQTLATSPFNKIRMALFPNGSVTNEPPYPFAGTPGAFDLTCFNPDFFRQLDDKIARLGALGIEADIILFHPYDEGKWGFDRMPAAADDRYVRYVVARLSAHRNVWWSIANEYDAMTHKRESDFDRFFQIVQQEDPYGHLRSIHHLKEIYNNAQPWVTHASLQCGTAVEDDERIVMLRDVWRKPVVVDEAFYEGNIAERWARLSGEEMVSRFWWGAIAGVYVGHGEYIEDGDHHMWVGTGGALHGTSAPRIAFLRRLLEDGPQGGLDPIDKWRDRHLAGKAGEYYLHYFGASRRPDWEFRLPKDGLAEGMRFAVDVIDSWNMEIVRSDATFEAAKAGKYDFVDKKGKSVPLPDRPWLALRIRRI